MRLLIAIAFLSAGVARADEARELRFTGDQLAARGAVDLATALALLPDVTVRDDGRGGHTVELRGARDGAVSLWIDGVRIAEPYDGGIDVATIPITDIVELRVGTAPQSALAGPGGAGGVIEVTTRDPVGPQLVLARLTADTQPGLGVAGSARVPLGERVGLRLSASGLAGARDLDANGASLGEARHAATAAGQLAYRSGAHRLTVDTFLDDRHLVAPPVPGAEIQLVDLARSLRGAVAYEGRIGQLQLEGRAWTQYFHRQVRFYADAARRDERDAEDLKSLRSGVTVLASRPFLGAFRWTGAVTVDFEKAATSNLATASARERIMTLEPAAGLGYAHGVVRAEASAGVAIPFGVGTDPWPVLAANVRLEPSPRLGVTGSAAYTARAPTLRERFDSAFGNTALTPERISHFELRATARLAWLRLELAPYYRHTDDAIELRPLLVNLAKINQWGVDGQAAAHVAPWLDVGTAYNYVTADAAPADDEPLRGLPGHRWDSWIAARPLARVSLVGRATYLGRAITGRDRIGRATVVEIDVAVRVTPDILVVLRGDDLLDRRPEDPAGVPGAGRTLSLVVQSQWE